MLRALALIYLLCTVAVWARTWEARPGVVRLPEWASYAWNGTGVALAVGVLL